jgi:hypothetical protein
MNLSIPREVQVSIAFIQIGEIDSIKEYFNAKVTIEAKWIDNSLKSHFMISDSKLTYDIEKHWNPKLSVENFTTSLLTRELSHEIIKEGENIFVIEKKTLEG